MDGIWTEQVHRIKGISPEGLNRKFGPLRVAVVLSCVNVQHAHHGKPRVLQRCRFLSFTFFFASADLFLAAAFDALIAISRRRSGLSFFALATAPLRPISESNRES